jgi:hypothetical protein
MTGGQSFVAASSDAGIAIAAAIEAARAPRGRSRSKASPCRSWRCGVAPG